MDHDPRPHDLPPAHASPIPPSRGFSASAGEAESPGSAPPHPPALRSRKRLALILFVATCASTFIVGMAPGVGSIAIFIDPDSERFTWEQVVTVLSNRQAWLNGSLYAAGVMAILLTHEMGHYVQARRHRVPATLPYFIPMPLFPFGTMGAVIVQGAGFADRKKLFDIAISGPLAGLAVALPVAWFGIAGSKYEEIMPPPPGQPGFMYGDPLILKWMVEWIHGPYPAGHDIGITPLLFAGWVGIFVTALNLIPVGQLDGGHILYTLIGRPAHYVALGILGVAVAAMLWFDYPAFLLLIVLLVVMGPRHPPTADDSVPLGSVRVLLGWLTLAFIIIGFTPMPIIEL